MPLTPAANAEDKRAELKAKLAAKAGGAHKARKATKEETAKKEQADKEAKEKAEKDKMAKAEKLKKVAEAARAAAAAAPPSVYADEKDEASQIGIHLGISCDGCGLCPPVIGKAWKCKDCPDFDLCDKCYPDRLDKAREAVAAAAGMPGKGRHPAGHCFAPRKAAVAMTPEACAKEIAAAETQTKDNKSKEEQPRKAGDVAAPLSANHFLFQPSAQGPARPDVAAIWKPSLRMAAECPTPNGPPLALKPKFAL